MKIITAALLSLTIVLSSFPGIAQAEETKTEPMVLAKTINMEQDTYREYRYDAEGRLVQELTGQGSGEAEVDREYFYYPNGVLKEEYRGIFSLNNELWADRKLEYDRYGYLQAENDGEITEYQNTYVTFNGRQRLKKSVCELSTGETIVVECTYHNKGTVWIERTVYAGGRRTDYRAGKFTEDGILLSSSETYTIMESMDANSVTTVTLDKQNYPVKRVIENTEPGIRRVFTQEYVNSYDSEGRILRTEEYNTSEYEADYDGSKSVEPKTLVTVLEYEYNAQGLLIRVLSTYVPTGDTEVAEIREYDEWGNMVYFKGNKKTPEIDLFFYHQMASVPAEEQYVYLPLSEALCECMLGNPSAS